MSNRNITETNCCNTNQIADMDDNQYAKELNRNCPDFKFISCSEPTGINTNGKNLALMPCMGAGVLSNMYNKTITKNTKIANKVPQYSWIMYCQNMPEPCQGFFNFCPPTRPEKIVCSPILPMTKDTPMTNPHAITCVLCDPSGPAQNMTKMPKACAHPYGRYPPTEQHSLETMKLTSP